MTVSNASSKQAPQAMNGIAVLFSFTFEALPDITSGIKATILEMATGIETALIFNDGGADGYTVVVNANGVGGSITVNSARTADFEITIFRSYTETQDTNYADFNAFPSETVEDNQDKLTFIAQQQSEIVNRAIVLPITTQGVSVTLPTPASDQFIGWNTLATALENKPDPSVSATASAVAAAASAAAALVSETNAAASAAASALSAVTSLASETASAVSAAAALVSETNAAASAASLALPTVTFPAQEGLILVARAAAAPDSYTLEAQGVGVTVDDFTLKNNGGILAVANLIVDNIMLNALSIAEQNSLTAGGMVDGFRDSYNDQLGVNLGASSDQVFETGSYRTPVPITLQDSKVILNATAYNGALEVLDSSTNTHIVTQVGNATLSPNLFKFGNGSLALDGINQAVTFPDHADFNFGSGDFTFDAWVYTRTDPSEVAVHNIITKGNDASSSWYFRTTTGNVLQFLGFNTGVGLFGLIDSAASLTANELHHVACIRASNDIAMYIDGFQVAHLDATGFTMFDGVALVQVGSQFSGGLPVGTWDGYIDDARITNNNAFSAVPIPRPFVHFTLDDNAASTSVLDSGSGANNGTTVGGNTDTFHAHGKVVNAFNFSGSGDYIENTSAIASISADTTGTICCWINPVSTSNEMVYSIANGVINSQNLVFRVLSGLLSAEHFAGSAQWTVPSINTIPTNVWTHVALAQDGVSPKIYINGIDDTGTPSISTNLTLWHAGLTGLTRLRVGRSAGASLSGEFSGRMEDWRYYQNTVLTQTQIESIRVAGLAGIYGLGSPNITVPTVAHTSNANTLLLCPFNSTTQGNDLLDISTGGAGSPRTATIHNGAGVTGKFGSSFLTFDGTGDYLTIPDDNSLDFGLFDFSISSWLRSKADGAIQYYFHKRTGVSSGELEFFKNSSNQLVLRTNNGAAVTATSVITLSDRDWHFVYAVRSGSDLGVYLDTAQIAFATGTIENMTSTGALFIGADVGGLNSLNGDMDDYHATNANPLSAVPVVGLTDTITLPTIQQAVVASTRLLINANTQDESLQFAIPTFNGASITSAQSQFGGFSYTFDGTNDGITFPASVNWRVGAVANQDKTIQMWVRHTDHVGVETYATNFVDVNNKWRLDHTHASGIQFVATEGGGSVISTVAGGEITDTNFHHVMLSVVGSENSAGVVYAIYVDGNQISYSQDASVSTLFGSLILGNSGSATNFFDGQIDGFEIVDNNIFSTVPNPGLTDTITVPVVAPSVDTSIGVMTIISNATQVAPLLPAPDNIIVYLDLEDIDPTIVLNTDVTLEVSRDNGTTFTTAVLALTGQITGNRRLVTDNVDVSAQPAPGAGLSQIITRIRTFNNVQQRFHATSELWG